MNTPRPILVDIKVNGIILTMEVGRSAGLSLISEITFKQMMSEDLDNLQESSVHMRTFSETSEKVTSHCDRSKIFSL